MNRYAHDENSWPRWIVVGGAVVAIAALLAVGFITGRNTAPSGGGQTQVVSVQSGPGPTHVVNGVPVGYAHTPAGAVAAATNYLEVFNGPLVTQPDRYHAAVDEMAATGDRSTLTKLADANLAGQQTYVAYAAQGRTVVHRIVPLAYRVQSVSDVSAQVSIWGETLIAVDGALPLKEGWGTATITLTWSDGDWKLSDFPTGSGAVSYGPVPVPVQAPDQSTTLPPQLVEYRGYNADVP